MPLNNRKEDDNLADASDYQVMPRQIVDDDDDNDFGFTNDDDDDGGGGGESNGELEAFNFDRYDQYELLSQDPIENGDVENGGQNGQYFEHNFVVQWIETDEPLFDREEFERRRRLNLQASGQNSARGEVSASQCSETTHSSLDNASPDDNSESGTNKPNDSATNNSDIAKSQARQDTQQLETEKIDIIKNLMANFKLPEENVPEWAKEIPENNWKNFLSKKLNP